MTIATGQPMLASDINNLTFFPKGAILTFSSTAWSTTSAEFKTIWKVCNAANHAADPTIPDLTNKFLRGAESSGAEGGADSRDVTLQTTNLPSHNHGTTGLSFGSPTLSLDSSGLKVAEGGSHEHILTGKAASAGGHSHGITDPGHSHSIKLSHLESKDEQTPTQSNNAHEATGYTESAKTGITINNADAHEHSFSSDSKAVAVAAHGHNISGNITGSITGGSISGSTDNAGTGQAFSVSTLPAYYAVIYIIKVV
ncbi:MAG: hypothetical protein LBK68_04095 [Candidatus Margulisbacteria bacterium]|jgi:hypothetical protein|nr:hypothetical protein [Candidatus Margulisiibacteriota bacterium]